MEEEEKEEKKVHNIHYRADFINKPHFHSDATLFTRIVYTENQKYSPVDVTFQMRDCSSSINLNLDASDVEEWENSDYKLQLILDHVSEFKAALRKAFLMNQKELKKKK